MTALDPIPIANANTKGLHGWNYGFGDRERERRGNRIRSTKKVEKDVDTCRKNTLKVCLFSVHFKNFMEALNFTLHWYKKSYFSVSTYVYVLTY